MIVRDEFCLKIRNICGEMISFFFKGVGVCGRGFCDCLGFVGLEEEF